MEIDNYFRVECCVYPFPSSDPHRAADAYAQAQVEQVERSDVGDAGERIVPKIVLWRPVPGAYQGCPLVGVWR